MLGVLSSCSALYMLVGGLFKKVGGLFKKFGLFLKTLHMFSLDSCKSVI